MLKYMKFLKDMLTNKRKFEGVSMVTLSEECLVILQNKLLTKKKDSGSFTILGMIGDLVNEKALVNLGASINVMPYTNFRKLGLSDLQPTRMTLPLADRSIRHPK